MHINPWPYYDKEQKNAVNRILSSGKVNQWTGNETKMFEKEFAEYVSSSHAIAVSMEQWHFI